MNLGISMCIVVWIGKVLFLINNDNIEYCTLTWTPRKLQCNIEIGGHAEKSDKTNKKENDYSYRERLED